ncbi:MAG: AraC family transcriptional regulator [Phycisphaeraceae bacterium]
MRRDLFRVNRAGHFVDMRPVVTQRDRPMDYLLIWAVQGEVTGAVGGRRFHAPAGSVLTFEPGVKQLYAAPAAGRWEWLWMHFAGEVAGPMVGALRRFGRPAARLGWHEPVRERFHELNVAAGAAGVSPRGSAAAHLDATGHSLLALILRRLDLDARVGSPRPGLDASAVQRQIHDHLAEPVTLEQLAAWAHLSPPHFSRLFKAAFGVPPMRYVIERRIDRACMLLTHTSLKLAEVARQVGYDDPYYFSRLFRKVRGMPPSAWRDKVTGEA